MALPRDAIQDQLGQWRDTNSGALLGGLNTDSDSELIEDSQLTIARECIVTYKELQSDTGHARFGQVGLRGNPRRVVEYTNPATHGFENLLITDLTCYRYDLSVDQWQYVSNGTETTLTAAEAGGSTVMDVASIVGFANGDHIGIQLDSGSMHMTTVSGAPAGGQITLAAGLPSAAAIGKAVIKAVLLTGQSISHVTAVVIPWNGNVVFTNSSDNVKIYDPGPGLLGSVVDLTGTGLPANTKCNTLALYDNSLILAGTTEAGTFFDSRFRYCAKGDLTKWNTLEAGSTDLFENFGAIKQALALGPYLIFYRKKGITRVSVGGAGRFTPDAAVPAAAGVASLLAAVDLVDKHLVLGLNKLYWYRGGFAIEEVDCSIKESIWGKSGAIKSNFVLPADMFLVPLPYRNEVLISYGTSNTIPSPRYHIESGVWTTRRIDNGLGRISGYGFTEESFGFSLGGMYICESVEDKVVKYDQANTTDDGDNINFEIQTKDFSHKSLLTKMDFVEFKLSGTGSPQISYSTDGGVTFTVLATQAITSTPTRYRFYKQATARMFRFRVTHTAAIVVHFFNFRHEFTSEF